MPLTQSVQAAVYLAERVALLYREGQRTLPATDDCDRVLDNLFELIVELEAIAAGEIGPVAREVLGPRD